MRRLWLLIPIALAAGSARAGVEDLGWLAGCWERLLQDGFTVEQWMRPEGDSLLGMSRTIRGGQTTGWEWLRIEKRGALLAYVAHPSGQMETVFTQVELSDSTAIFASAQHDFPDRITYRLQPSGQLLAAVEGRIDGSRRRVDFHFRRVPCDGPTGLSREEAHLHYALTPAEALELAVDLANERCRQLYGRAPFTLDSYGIRFVENRWSWGALDLVGVSGLSAEVRFDANGHQQEVEVYLSTDAVMER